MPVSHATLPILNADEVLKRFGALRAKQPVKFWAFYSSQLGGVVTDPSLMVMPFDDHMVHRGHGIFDTAGSWTARSTTSRRTSIGSCGPRSDRS